MRPRPNAAFTLVELTIALTLTALVALAALTAFHSFVDADRRASDNLETTTAVARALQTVCRDLSDAAAIDVGTAAFVATQRDGTAVGYAIAAGGTEIHRFVAADPTTAANLARAAVVAATTSATYGNRGHLKDSSYRAEAILQGAGSITVSALTRGTSTLGVQLTVRAANGVTTQCQASSHVLLETNGKVAAATGGSGSGSGSGSGLSDLLNGVTGIVTGLGSGDASQQSAQKVK